MLVVTTPTVPGRGIAEALGRGGDVLMASANGTAVRLR